MRTQRLSLVLSSRRSACWPAAPSRPARAREAAPPAADDRTAAATDTVATVNGQTITSETFDVFVQAVTGKPAAEATAEQKTAGARPADQHDDLAARRPKRKACRTTPTSKARISLMTTQILAQAATEKYIKSHPVSETEVKAEYDAQVAKMPIEYKAQHILVDTKEKAEAIIKQLDAGADFAKLAAKDSKDPSGKNGGDLGWFNPQSMVKPFADAVEALKKGETTQQPVQTQYGWHVIRLEDTRKPTIPAFDDVKAQVETMTQRKKLQDYLDQLRKTAKIQKTS